MNFSTFNEYFLYENGKLYWKKTTANRVFVGDEAGSLQGDGYLKVCLFGKKHAVHRIIYVMHNQFNPEIVDHIDGNRLNNKIENLRGCTTSQNNKNTGFRKHNTSGAKNVFWVSKTKKWRVKVVSNKRQIYFGSYEDIELAELVAIEARSKYHGQYASNR